MYRYSLQILQAGSSRAGCIALDFKNIPNGNEAALDGSVTESASAPSGRTDKGEQKMLYYALVFLLIAILAAVFGFGGVAIASAGIAKILFFVFIVLFVVSLITHMSRRV